MKKNFLQILAVVAIMLFFAASFTPLAANTLIGIEQVGKGGGFYIDVTGNGVRGRMGPGLNYQDTGARYNKGDHLLVFSQKNGWYEVRSTVGEENVWITSQFAKRSKRQTPDYVTVAIAEPVRLRLSPNGKDSGLSVYFEDTFKYLGEQGNWYKISHKGKVYWISKDDSWAE